MADFPASIFEQREIQNLPGITYDGSKKTAIFADDIQALGDEITALETFFDSTGYYFDNDVTVTEFFTGPVDLGTGGSCRVDMQVTGQFIWTRIKITIGTSPSLGSLPLVIMTDDLPFEIPTFEAQEAIPGNFGALTQASNAVQMFAPTVNNITGFGQCILFFKQNGAAFTDYLFGVNSVATLGAGDTYTGSIFIPRTNFLDT